jgi:hypothetical protein
MPQLISDSEAEVPCADDGKSSRPREANDVEEDVHEDATFELPDIPFLEVVNESETHVQKALSVTDHHDTSLANNIVGHHSDSGIHGDQIEEKDILLINQEYHHNHVFVCEDSCIKGKWMTTATSTFFFLFDRSYNRINDRADVDVSQCLAASS